MKNWLVEAAELGSLKKQASLFLDVKKSSSRPKDLSHAVFLESDDGSVSVISVASPDVVPENSDEAEESAHEPSASSASEVPSPPPVQRVGETPVSLSSAGTFMRQLKDLALDNENELAVVTPTPGVHASREDGENAAHEESPVAPEPASAFPQPGLADTIDLISPPVEDIPPAAPPLIPRKKKKTKTNSNKRRGMSALHVRAYVGIRHEKIG